LDFDALGLEVLDFDVMGFEVLAGPLFLWTEDTRVFAGFFPALGAGEIFLPDFDIFLFFCANVPHSQ
jgi:hypothetical protein